MMSRKIIQPAHAARETYTGLIGRYACSLRSPILLIILSLIFGFFVDGAFLLMITSPTSPLSFGLFGLALMILPTCVAAVPPACVGLGIYEIVFNKIWAVEIYGDRLIGRLRNSQVYFECPWCYVSRCYFSSKWLGTKSGIVLVMADGKRVFLENRLKPTTEMVLSIAKTWPKEQFEAAIAALSSGRSVGFGDITATSVTLSTRKQSIRWDHMRAWQLEESWLLLIASPRDDTGRYRNPIIRIRYDKTPDIFVLIALVDRMIPQESRGLPTARL